MEKDNPQKLTDKQRRFCEEYLCDMNATQAAIRAGYSKKTARQIGTSNLSKASVRAYLDELMDAQRGETVATEEECLKYLSSVVRGNSVSSEVVVEGVGKGYSTAREISINPKERDRVKAAELLMRAHGSFWDKQRQEAEQQRLQIERERLEIEKKKAEQQTNPDQEIHVVIEGYNKSWSE